MKKIALCLALLGLLGLGGQALAVICTIDEVPAATLLLPYFEVDFDNPNGANTLFSINNASATAVLAHVVVWSDLSKVVLDFNVYLTGYDVQTISVSDLLHGVLPQTASAGQDPGDHISPKGTFSQDINFASCSGGFLPPPVSLGTDFVNHLRNATTGRPDPLFHGPNGLPGCFGRNLGDNIGRGYITVDTVNSCTLANPGTSGYFSTITTAQNVLWGDYFYVNNAANFADGNPLVHIEASLTDPATTTPGNYTFYGRYDTVPFTAEDHREPLSTNFATRFLNGGTFSGGTDLIVWRDSHSTGAQETQFNCGDAGLAAANPWYPLGEEGIVIFDEQEQPNLLPTFPISPQPESSTPSPFPAETQSVHVGGDDLPVPYAFGWMYLNLNTTIPSEPAPADIAADQAWVVTRMTSQGRFSVGFDAIQLDSACAALHFCPGGCSPSTP
ncbi:MAG TPA: hypothetical protein VGG20_21440 [Thermoanaerobaculia bacterium]